MAKRIRAIALGLIEYERHVFVSQGRDPATGEPFYRFLGGGIDFGETSQAALIREFEEEIQAALIDVEYLTCLDNIFTYNGKLKHELIQLFRAKFANPNFYQLQETFPLIEGKRISQAFWIPTAEVFSCERRLVPESCIAHLSR
ncbi:MAG: NUDIX domain-containing protein [Cyanobacteria bacterium J06554_11]